MRMKNLFARYLSKLWGSEIPSLPIDVWKYIIWMDIEETKKQYKTPTLDLLRSIYRVNKMFYSIFIEFLNNYELFKRFDIEFNVDFGIESDKLFYTIYNKRLYSYLRRKRFTCFTTIGGNIFHGILSKNFRDESYYFIRDKLIFIAERKTRFIDHCRLYKRVHFNPEMEIMYTNDSHALIRYIGPDCVYFIKDFSQTGKHIYYYYYYYTKNSRMGIFNEYQKIYDEEFSEYYELIDICRGNEKIKRWF